MAPAEKDALGVGLTLGIDLGNSKCVVASSRIGNAVGKADLVMNEMSNRATPCMVSFHGKERSVGEKAQGQLGVNPKNTITHLLRLLGQSMAQISAKPNPHFRFVLGEDQEGRAVVQVNYRDSEMSLLPEQLLAMLLAQLAKHAKTTAPEGAPISTTVIAVPAMYSESQYALVHAAASIAGLSDGLSIITTPDAAMTCYNVQHPAEEFSSEADSPPRHVMLLDIGHAFSSCSVYRLTSGEPPHRLSCSASDSLGGYALDSKIFAEFQTQCGAHNVTISPGSRAGYRLLVECEKVKKTLSTIAETFTVLECVGEGEKDIKLPLTRAKFEELCSNERAALTSIIEGALRGAGLLAVEIAAVELVGGTTRVPWVKKSVCDVFGDSKILSTMLDSSSCFALGAAFVGEALALKPLMSEGYKAPAALEKLQQGINRVTIAWEAAAGSVWGTDALIAASELEKQMQHNDAEEAALADARNALESFILQMRSAVAEGKHGGALKDSEVGSMLDAGEDWMYGEGEDSDLRQYQDFLKDLEDKIRASSPGWFEAEEAERKRIEDDLVAQAALATKEDKEDHDNRKMAKPERMRLVNLNKEEANELFKDGNLAPAVQRWAKALQHCDKFFDLSPEDKKEVDGVMLSLHLNLGMGYLKLADLEADKNSRDAEDLLRKVKDHCDSALGIDSGNVKALFRRATAMEKLKYFDEAYKDCKAALELEPDDKMVIKLYERVKKARAKRLEKEKNFAKKMFG